MRQYIQGQLIKASQKVYPFQLQNQTQLVQRDHFKFDYKSNISQVIFKKNKDEMKYFNLTPKQISEELCTFLNENEYDIKIDAHGLIHFRIKNETLDHFMHEQMTQKQNQKEDKKIGIIYPFGEFGQKMFTNSFRAFNRAEILYRIFEQQYQPERITCIKNFAPFHGILTGALSDIYTQETTITFEILTKYLHYKGLRDDNAIKQQGINILNQMQQQDNTPINQVYQRMNKHANDDLIENFNYFIPKQLDELQTLTQKDLQQSFYNVIDDDHNFLQDDKGYYLEINKKKIYITDDQGLLNQSGQLMEMCFYAQKNHNIHEFILVAEHTERDQLKNVQKILDHLKCDINLRLILHQPILMDTTKFAYLQQLIKEIQQQTIDYILPKNKNLRYDQLSMQNLLQFTKLSLGWIRYFDHTEQYSQKLYIDVKTILDNPRVESRLKLQNLIDEQGQKSIETDQNLKRNIQMHIIHGKEIIEEIKINLDTVPLYNHVEEILDIIQSLQVNDCETLLLKQLQQHLTDMFYFLGIIDSKE